MSLEEIFKHLEFTIPYSWRDEMNRQGFIVTENSLDEFVEFCQRLEMGEDVYNATHTGKKSRAKGSEKKDSSEKKNKKKRKAENNKFCLFHGWNPTHSPNKCLVLKAQAKKMAKQQASLGKGKYAKK